MMIIVIHTRATYLSTYPLHSIAGRMKQYQHTHSIIIIIYPHIIIIIIIKVAASTLQPTSTSVKEDP